MKNPEYKFDDLSKMSKFLIDNECSRLSHNLSNSTYINKETFIKKGKIYNLLVVPHGELKVVKVIAGLKIHQSSFGKYANTKYGRAYLELHTKPVFLPLVSLLEINERS